SKNKVILGEEGFEEVSGLGLDSKGLRRVLTSAHSIFVQVLEDNSSQPLEVVRDHHVGRHNILVKPDHTATTYSGESGVLEVLDFKHDTYIRWKIEALAVRQGKQFVVIEDTVQVLNPLGVDITIENDPVSLGILSTEIVHNLTQDTCKQTVSPFAR